MTCSKRQRNGAWGLAAEATPVCNPKDTRRKKFRAVGTLIHIKSRVADIRAGQMSSRQDELSRIEETQQALRDSINASKDLAERADQLVRAHKRNMDCGQAAEPRPVQSTS
jgi:hypothetical protein